MTGFGVGDAPLGEGRLVLELRSLNHRFLEVRVRLPAELVDHAFWLEQLARERLTRGRFDLGVRLEGAAIPPPRFAMDRARAIYRALAELRDDLAPGTELPIASIAALPDVLTLPGSVDTSDARRALQAAFARALIELEAMRRSEGAALGRALGERLHAARALRNEITARGGELVEGYRARLHDKLERLLRDAAVALDAGRLETEVALMADRSDITEELVRLDSHFAQFDQLLSGDDAVGRRLDFLLQEVSREVNTIGAKCQDAPVAHLVVALKAEIERLREQVQNVE
jgi:uncharacterized protein (TIGR00255 family)